MIVDGQIKFKDVLTALDVKSIPGCDDDPEDWVRFADCVEIDECELPECDICGGKWPDEPEDHAVNDWLIKDFITAIRTGDITTAQCLVGRVFELPDDVGLVSKTLSLAA